MALLLSRWGAIPFLKKNNFLFIHLYTFVLSYAQFSALLQIVLRWVGKGCWFLENSLHACVGLVLNEYELHKSPGRIQCFCYETIKYYYLMYLISLLGVLVQSRAYYNSRFSMLVTLCEFFFTPSQRFSFPCLCYAATLP